MAEPLPTPLTDALEHPESVEMPGASKSEPVTAPDEPTEHSPRIDAPLPPLRRAPSHSRRESSLPKSSWLRALDALLPWALLLLGLLAAAAAYHYTLWRQPAPISFAHRVRLLLLALVPLLAARLFHQASRRRPAMLHSRTAALVATRPGLIHYLRALPTVLRLVALALLVVALARPQQRTADSIEVEGIDVVLALDVSNSMGEQDLAPTRLDAAKEVLRRFIEQRPSDRLGLVLFGRDAFTQCPLTLDHHALLGLLADVRLGLIDGQGTAIGNAVATALNRLRHSDARSKVIVLLTDGDNNAGNVSPQQAARFAQSLGVKVFTVLMGSDVDRAADPSARLQTRFPVNPKLLEEIAGATGGTPYLATDTQALGQRFQAILDELDRSRIKDQKGRPRELATLFVVPALALLLLELGLSLTRFRRFP